MMAERKEHNFTPLQLMIVHLFLVDRVICCGDHGGWCGKFVGMKANGMVTIDIDGFRPSGISNVEQRPLEEISLPFLNEPYGSLETALQVILGLVKE